MRSAIAVLGIAITFAVCSVTTTSAQLQLGASITDQGLQSFYVAIGQYYHVPERQVIVVRERSIPDDEIPVVFFIARRAHVEPSVIIELRSRGQSWMDISLHYGIGPEVYYVPVTTAPGPPYGHAYGYYKKQPKKQWKSIRLDDADIVNLVNLRFVSEHYGYSAPEVIKMRSGGKSFVVINQEIQGKKHHNGGREGNKGSNKGNSKGKGKRKG